MNKPNATKLHSFRNENVERIETEIVWFKENEPDEDRLLDELGRLWTERDGWVGASDPELLDRYQTEKAPRKDPPPEREEAPRAEKAQREITPRRKATRPVAEVIDQLDATALLVATADSVRDHSNLPEHLKETMLYVLEVGYFSVDREGNPNPRVSNIAVSSVMVSERFKVGRTTAWERLDRLCDRFWLRVVRHGGKKHANLYKILVANDVAWIEDRRAHYNELMEQGYEWSEKAMKILAPARKTLARKRDHRT